MPVVSKPTYQAADSHTDQALLVVNLRNELGLIRSYLIDELGYPAEDARVVGVTNLAAMVNSAFYVKNLLSIIERGHLDFGEVLSIPASQRAESVPVLMRTWSAVTKSELTVMYQFQLENFLRNVCWAQGIANPPTGFWTLAECVLREAGFRAPERNADVLNVTQLQRNSLHNNGIHRGQSKRTQISGVVYSFTQDAVQMNSTWPKAVLALRASTWVVARLMTMPKMRAIQPPIIDPYADAVGYQSV